MPKERYFLSGDRLKVVSFHVLLLDTAGNNLVNADFSPYFRMFFAVKYIYLTLYIVHICRVASTYSVPIYLLAVLFTALLDASHTCPLSLRRRARWRSLSVLLAALAVPAPVRPCALRPDRFRPIVVPAPAPAPVCARAWPRLLPLVASFHSPIMYILRRYARLARRVVRSAHSAANFFEIVFKLSISVRLSSAGWVTRLDIAVWADLGAQ